MIDLDVGSRVKLIVGGPLMLVNAFESADDDYEDCHDYIECVWVDSSNDIQISVFNISLLEKVNNED